MSANKGFGFDYHLTAKEQAKIERLVPLHQAKIHLAFRANITINDKLYKEGSVALSEHIITLCKKSLVGHSLSKIESIHLLDVLAFSTSSETHCRIKTDTEDIRLASPVLLRFARVLIRNYFVITTLFPPKMRFQFRPHDPSAFPPFNPSMSISQMFQFTYNANCSYFNTSYFHEVVRFFHNLVITGNGVADLRRLPMSIMEVNLGDPIDLRPLFSAMMFCPITYGVCCSDIARPDIVKAIAPLIIANKNIKIVSLRNVNAEIGTQELGEALRHAESNSVVYWDLSGNPFSDITPFVIALGGTNAPVFYIDLSDTQMSSEASTVLFGSMRANHALWGVRYLSIRNSDVSDEAIQTFASHLEQLYNNRCACMKVLDFGGTGGAITPLLSALSRYPQPLQALRLSRTRLSKKPLAELLSLLRSADGLEELDISGAGGLRTDSISEIITAISGNPRIKQFKLCLADLGVHSKKLPGIVKALEARKDVWVELSFQDCGIRDDDLLPLINALAGLPNLRRINLGGNMTPKSKIAQISEKLFNIESLEAVLLQGRRKRVLGPSGLRAVLRQAAAHSNIKTLDVSNSKAGDDGLLAFTQFLEDNRVIEELFIDGCEPKTHTLFIPLFDTIKRHPTLQNCPMPQDDIYRLLEAQPRAQRSGLFILLADKQKLSQEQMQINMANAGLHSDLSKKKIPELDEVIDQITLDVHDSLKGMRITEHNGIATTFSLPMPHLSEEESAQIRLDFAQGQTKDEYEAPQSQGTIRENNGEVEDADKFKTLQFNSLCIRRLGNHHADPALLRPSMESSESEGDPHAAPETETEASRRSGRDASGRSGKKAIEEDEDEEEDEEDVYSGETGPSTHSRARVKPSEFLPIGNSDSESSESSSSFKPRAPTSFKI